MATKQQADFDTIQRAARNLKAKAELNGKGTKFEPESAHRVSAYLGEHATGLAYMINGNMVTPEVPTQEGWQLAEGQARIEGDWQMLYSHDTMGITEDKRPRHAKDMDRIDLGKSPDDRPTFIHTVKKGRIIDPLGIDTPNVKFDAHKYSRVWARYRHWIADQHLNQPGKVVALAGGRGWTGDSYTKHPRRVMGAQSAFMANVMHPIVKPQGKGNYPRLYCTVAGNYAENDDYYGHIGTTPMPATEPGRWHTMDIIVDKWDGYRLLMNGTEIARVNGNPIARRGKWEDLRCVWLRNRHMFGGTPRKLPAPNDSVEYFAGLHILALAA